MWHVAYWLVNLVVTVVMVILQFCDIIANIVVVDEIAIGYFEYTFNVCNCWCYSNYYDEKVVPCNNHFPFVVAFDTKILHLTLINKSKFVNVI